GNEALPSHRYRAPKSIIVCSITVDEVRVLKPGISVAGIDVRGSGIRTGRRIVKGRPDDDSGTGDVYRGTELVTERCVAGEQVELFNPIPMVAREYVHGSCAG